MTFHRTRWPPVKLANRAPPAVLTSPCKSGLLRSHTNSRSFRPTAARPGTPSRTAPGTGTRTSMSCVVGVVLVVSQIHDADVRVGPIRAHIHIRTPQKTLTHTSAASDPPRPDPASPAEPPPGQGRHRASPGRSLWDSRRHQRSRPAICARSRCRSNPIHPHH